MSRQAAPIPQRYLNKPGGVWRGVRLLDIAVMLYNAHKMANDGNLGWDDAKETLDEVTRKLNRTIFMDPNRLESLLWACNMRHEAGEFEHPSGLTFDAWISRAIKGKFDKRYNTISWNDGKNEHQD